MLPVIWLAVTPKLSTLDTSLQNSIIIINSKKVPLAKLPRGSSKELNTESTSDDSDIFWVVLAGGVADLEWGWLASDISAAVRLPVAIAMVMRAMINIVTTYLHYCSCSDVAVRGRHSSQGNPGNLNNNKRYNATKLHNYYILSNTL